MKKSPIGIAIFVVLVLFFLLFGWGLNRSHAAGLTTTTWVANVGRGYDQGWECDSVWLVYQNYPSPDSLFRIVMTKNAVVDTHSYFANIAISATHPAYQLNVWALAWLNTLSYPVEIDVHNSGMNILTSDTTRVSNATAAVIDSADIQTIIDAVDCGSCAGVGLNTVRLIALDTSNHVRLPDIDLQIFLLDQVTQRGHAVTNGTGYFDFSLDNGTYLVRAGAPPAYFMETANDTVVVSGPTQDTIELYALTLTPPTGGESCLVIVFTNDPSSTAIIGRIETDGSQDTAGVVLTPYVDAASADGNGTILFTLPRTGATRQKTRWHIDVKDGYNTIMLSIPNYTVPNQSMDTLLAPLKNQ